MDLEFWFEFASTYSYLTVMRIEQLASTSGVALTWRPFLLGPIFAAQGWNDSPFNIYLAKGHYMWRDLERRAYSFGIPFQRPTQFPRNGLLAARVALLAAREDWCPIFTKAVFQANFTEDRDIGNPTVITAILDSLGKNGKDVCERAQSAANKDALREQTDEARQRGIFGAPSFCVGQELFWGDDRLEEAIGWACKTRSTGSRQ